MTPTWFNSVFVEIKDDKTFIFFKIPADTEIPYPVQELIYELSKHNVVFAVNQELTEREKDFWAKEAFKYQSVIN